MTVLSAKETAEYLNISYTYFMFLLKNKPDSIPPYITMGNRTYRWTKESIDKWLINKNSTKEN